MMSTTRYAELRTEFINRWKRFLDDCFMLWTQSQTELETLQNLLNELHIDINFTVEYNKHIYHF